MGWCPRRGYICCAATTARCIRVGRSISSADSRAIEPAPRVGTRQAGCQSSWQMRYGCPTAPPRAARRHASNACRGPTSSRCSAPVRPREGPVLGPDERTFEGRQRVRSPTACDRSHTAGDARPPMQRVYLLLERRGEPVWITLQPSPPHPTAAPTTRREQINARPVLKRRAHPARSVCAGANTSTSTRSARIPANTRRQ